MSADLIFVSAEASGDEMSVDVIREIRKHAPDYHIAAVGGDGLHDVGLTSPIDVSPLGVVGLIEGLKIYKEVIRIADETVAFIIDENPRAVVLVDSWGFSIRVAQRLKKQAPHIKVIKLIGPQVWATRPGRAKTLSDCVDHLLCIHAFEVPFYEPYNLPCTVIGNPALHRLPKGNPQRFRQEEGLEPDEKVLLVLPGSRSSEIKKVAPELARAACLTSEECQVRTYVLVAHSAETALKSQELIWPNNTIFFSDLERKADLMAASTFALACSGTVTTEVAAQGTPMLVGYKMGWLTWTIAKAFLLKIQYASLINIALDREAIPEFLQGDLVADDMATCARAYLESDEQRDVQKRDLKKALDKMGWDDAPADEIAAKSILDQIS